MSFIYFTPGPSQLYPSYAQHMHEALQMQLGSINHRSNTFRDIYQHTDTQLRQLLQLPKSHSIFFASSATEIWEKLLLHGVEKKSFHCVNGSFSKRFYEFAQYVQKQPIAYTVNDGQGIDIDKLSIPANTELICTTQNETSTGAFMRSEDLTILKQRYPNSLLCSDLVSIAPYSKIDYTHLDASFFSVQKAFGMPPGLGVWIVNQAFIEKAKEVKSKGYPVGAHNTIESFVKYYASYETPSTPNVMAIYLLGKIAEEMNAIGIENIRASIDKKAHLLYTLLEESTQVSAFVKEKIFQSPTVAVLNTKGISAPIIEELRNQHLVVGSGYGALKTTQIRIANFPATSEEQMLKLVSSLAEIIHP